MLESKIYKKRYKKAYLIMIEKGAYPTLEYLEKLVNSDSITFNILHKILKNLFGIK